MLIDEQIDLVAFIWLGRDGYSVGDWSDIRAQAALTHNKLTAAHLCRTPLLADHLADSLSILGLSCTAAPMSCEASPRALYAMTSGWDLTVGDRNVTWRSDHVDTHT